MEQNFLQDSSVFPYCHDFTIAPFTPMTPPEMCDSPVQTEHYHIPGPYGRDSSFTWHSGGYKQKHYYYYYYYYYWPLCC
jgi:hypothetical protein